MAGGEMWSKQQRVEFVLADVETTTTTINTTRGRVKVRVTQGAGVWEL